MFVEQVSAQDRMRLALDRLCTCGNPKDRYLFTIAGTSEGALRSCCRKAAADKAGVSLEQLEVVLGPWETD